MEIRLPPSLLNPPSPPTDATRHAAAAAKLAAVTLYEDDTLLVINKPSGLAVQGGSGLKDHVDAWLDAWNQHHRTGEAGLRLVHRLDKDTSGVLLLAKGANNAAMLTGLFRDNQVQKTYWALVEGIPKKNKGVIEAALRKAALRDGEKMVVDEENGLPAQTHFECRASANGQSWLILTPKQGRTHQLRVHCAHLGHPITGDRKYGSTTNARLHLHAWRLRLRHPVSGKTLTIDAPLPLHMVATWNMLGLFT